MPGSEQNATHGGGLPIVAIVGRPNVGKSSLFNRIAGRRIAIVHEEPGVTRDRIVAPCQAGERHFLLVDTGGLGMFADETRTPLFDGLIRTQVDTVLADADRIVWVVDARDGVTPLDRDLAAYLRVSGKTVILVANKADNPTVEQAAGAEFPTLGMGEALPISCTHNRGIGRLVEAVVRGLNAPSHGPAPRPNDLKLAVVGRPNVGKSSIVNRLVGGQRVLVSETPGTTRDAVDIPVAIVSPDGPMPVTLIDTAGLRQRREVHTAVEMFSVMRAENAIKRCDVALFVLDAGSPATAQDRRIARLIIDHRRPCIIVANKWDLASRETRLADLRDTLRTKMGFLEYPPVLAISALSGYNFKALVASLHALRAQLDVRVPTGLLNQYLRDVFARTPPPSGAGNRFFKFYYATMLSTRPPHLVLVVNHTDLCPPHYLQFLVNRVRDAFYPGLGMPVWIEFKARRDPAEHKDGARQAIAGVMRRKREEQRAVQRRRERAKRWRR